MELRENAFRPLRLRSALLAVVLPSALVLALWCWFLPRSPKSAHAEALRSGLFLKDGRLYAIGRTVPFTGIMLEKFENGTLKSRSVVSNGVLHGVSEGWHTNGQRQVEEHFVNGVSHGLRTKWHDNGRMLSQVTIVNGQLHGTFRKWTAEGALSEEVMMAHGQPDGLSRAFHPSGSVRAEVTLRNGQVVESRFWKDGERRLSSANQVAAH